MSYNIENRRYTGSKAKLSSWITDLIKSECRGKSFLDIFAGTGVISARLFDFFEEIIVNDFLESNNIIYKGFFLNGKWDEKKISNLIDKYNQIAAKKLKENYFSAYFGDKYFSKNDAKIIGHIREDIEKKKSDLTEKEYAVLLSSLLYSVDKIANTVGHYDAYRMIMPKENIFKMRQINPIKINVEIFKEDANKLAKRVKADVVYIDPPYNSRQYSRFYHVLENLTKWDKPELFGTALKPKPSNMSDYCKTKAPEIFCNLIKDLQCSHIVVSYNNTYSSKSKSSRNKIELSEIKSILEKRGETKVFCKPHKHFNAGNTKFNNHQEYIFITKVKSR